MRKHDVTVERDLRIGDEQFAAVVTTRYAGSIAYTAIHRQEFARRIGGLRFALRGGLVEVGHLASAMTSKCGAALIPFDGEKSLVCTPAGRPATAQEKVALIAVHLRDVVRADAGATLGPDMYAGEDVMSILGQDPEFQQHITGKNPAVGGLGIDSNGATAEGIYYSMLRFLEADSELRRVTIQGFGAVGADIARRLSERGLEVRAVSNFRGTLEAAGPAGLDVQALIDLRQPTTGRGETDDMELALYAESHPDCIYHEGDRARLFKIETDVFLPAARTMVLAEADELGHARAENPEVEDIRLFFAAARPRLVVEGANHPLSVAAEHYLESQGVRVLTDFLVNMGGVIGCLFEWAYLPELVAEPSILADVNALARRWSRMIGERNMDTILESSGSTRNVGMRLAERNLGRMKEVFQPLAGGRPQRETVREYMSNILENRGLHA